MFSKFIKTSLSSVILFSGISVANLEVNAKTIDYKAEVLKLQPDVNAKTIEKEVKSIAKSEKKTKQEIYKQLYKELNNNAIAGKKEAATYKTNTSSKIQVRGGNNNTSSAHYIKLSDTKKFKVGQIYYTPSQTAKVDHGHVGMILNSRYIVESIPSSGVRKIKAVNRRVDNKGAVLKNVNVSAVKRKAAANWALTQVGKKYSNNFATNRKTSHYGAKNCSKLIWSAYKVKAKIDLDKDRGLGVYPRDIRDAKQTNKVMSL